MNEKDKWPYVGRYRERTRWNVEIKKECSKIEIVAERKKKECKKTYGSTKEQRDCKGKQQDYEEIKDGERETSWKSERDDP